MASFSGASLQTLVWLGLFLSLPAVPQCPDAFIFLVLVVSRLQSERVFLGTWSQLSLMDLFSLKFSR